MPRESVPKPPVVRSTNADDLVRRREGCVGDDGVRRIRMGKTAAEFDDPRLFEQYQERGYTITDRGYYYELAIDQAKFEQMEAARVAADLRRLAPQPKDPAFDRDLDETLSPISAAELAAS